MQSSEEQQLPMGSAGVTGFVRIRFPLEQLDNWPPVAAENLWGLPGSVEGEYVIDNIPFFVRGLSRFDTVQAEAGGDDILTFVKILGSSGHSTIRVFVSGRLTVEQSTLEIEKLGCGVETGGFKDLLAVDIPDAATRLALIRTLKEWKRESLVEYEDGKIA
jgi:hypothetical protein